MQPPVAQIYLFEGFTLDLRRGCLREVDREIELRPKSFAMLRHFVENAGRLISKDELAKAIWPNVVVSVSSAQVPTLGPAADQPRQSESTVRHERVAFLMDRGRSSERTFYQPTTGRERPLAQRGDEQSPRKSDVPK